MNSGVLYKVKHLYCKLGHVKENNFLLREKPTVDVKMYLEMMIQ